MTNHTDICSGEHDLVSGACVGFKEGDRVKYAIDAQGDFRTILAHLNITLRSDDPRTEAQISELLSGMVEVGAGVGDFDGVAVEITLVEEV